MRQIWHTYRECRLRTKEDAHIKYNLTSEPLCALTNITVFWTRDKMYTTYTWKQWNKVAILQNVILLNLGVTCLSEWIHIKWQNNLAKAKINTWAVVVTLMVDIVVWHRATYQTNYSFCDKSTKFDRFFDIYLGNRPGYWAIVNSHRYIEFGFVYSGYLLCTVWLSYAYS